MVFPLAGLVSEAFREPVIRETMDPSAALSALTNSLPASSVPWISYPQTMGSTVAVGGSGMTCHPPPPPVGQGRGGRRRRSEHAQQRAERHDHSNSPHGEPA